MPTKSLHLQIPNRKPFDRDECWFETFVGLHLVPIINKHPIQRFWFTRYGARGGFNVLFRFEPADSLKSPLISGHENPQSVRKSPKPPTTRVHQSTDSLIRNLLLTTVLIAGMAGAQEFPKGVYGKLRTGEIVSPASLLPVSKEDYINPILSRLSWNKPDVLNLECRQLFPGWKEGMICTTNLIETEFGRLHSNVVNRCLERLLCNLAMEDSELTNTTPSLRELGTLAKQQADYALNRIETFFPVTFSANESEFRTRSEAFFKRYHPDDDAKTRFDNLDRVSTRWRSLPRDGKILEIRRHVETVFLPDFHSLSNNAWHGARANLVIQQIAKTVVLPTAEMTNQFLATLPDRFQLEYLITDDANLAKQVRDSVAKLLHSPKSIPASLHDVPHGGPSSRVLRTRTSQLALELSLGQPLTNLSYPAVFQFDTEADSALLRQLRGRLGGDAKRQRVVILIFAPEQQVLGERSRWQQFLDRQKLQQVYQRILTKFETINPDLFPTIDSLSWLVRQGPHFQGIER